MKQLFRLMVYFGSFFTIFLSNFTALQAELIEPTRTLKGAGGDAGHLTIFSEPPGLAVKLDGTPIGQTPLRIQTVGPGMHRLQIRESVTEIYIEPGKTLHISLFKNRFIQFEVVKKKPAKQQETEKFPKSETKAPEQKKVKEEDRRAWERWMHFVNGSSKHF